MAALCGVIGGYGSMRIAGVFCLYVFLLTPFFLPSFLSHSLAEAARPSTGEKASPGNPKSESDSEGLEEILGSAERIEAAVIHPYRTANVGSEVSGVVKAVNYNEGERIEKGDTVCEIDDDRYAITAGKAKTKLRGLELALKTADQKLKLQEDLVALGASNLQEVLKARAERDIAREKVQEAGEELRLAALNLRACSVKAPFAGYLAVRYKEPYETVERLGRLFAIVDGSQVYAVANLPEKLLPKFKPGTEALFVHATGKKFKGTVEKVGALTDPKSRTRKVFILIDNSKGELQIGTTGSIGLEE